MAASALGVMYGANKEMLSAESCKYYHGVFDQSIDGSSATTV